MNKHKEQRGSGKFNLPFYNLRKSRRLSQRKMGELLDGYSQATVGQVENGIVYGNFDFWIKVQKVFQIPDEDMWTLIMGKEHTDNKSIEDCLDKVFFHCRQHQSNCSKCIFHAEVKVDGEPVSVCRVTYAPDVFPID